MLHPFWYYQLYKEVFEKNRDYACEIDFINRIFPINGASVVEIGSGTGRHAEQLVKYRPLHLELVDIDMEAFYRLKEKFTQSNVEIINADGFETGNQADLVVCMFSVVQQTSIDGFWSRVELVRNRIVRKGCFVFEFIDTEKSESLFPSGLKNKLCESQDLNVFIETIYEEDQSIIRYSGTFRDREITYDAVLARLETEELLKKYNGQITIQPLDNFGRRNLAAIRKI